jgi:DegV family protein with EDD domain
VVVVALASRTLEGSESDYGFTAMTVRIVTDSSCDLPQDMADALGITIVPLSVRFGDTEYIDRTTITTDEFWAKCSQSPVLPETAAPAPGQFKNAYENLAAAGATSVVVIALSSSLSATMQSAELAAKDVAGSIDVRIIDSRNASMGLGLTVLDCAEAARKGASVDEVVALAHSLIPRTHVFGALDTLENLKKGGRIGGAKAMLASALSIKPLIEVRDGLVEEAGKQRTRSKALAFLVDVLKQNDGKLERVGILHAQCPDIDAFIQMVKSVYSGDVIVGDIGAVIGTHAGVGTIGIAFRQSA